MTTINQRVPFVIESTGRGDREMDIFSRLLKDRIIFLTGGVDDDVANLIIAEMRISSACRMPRSCFINLTAA